MRSFLPLLVALVAAAPQAPSAEPPPLTPEVRRDVVGSLIDLLADIYVIPETAAQLGEMLTNNLEAGAYDGMSRAELAAALTADMQELSHDRHLRVSQAGESGFAAPDPEGGGEAGGPRCVVKRVPGGEEGGPARVVRRVRGEGVEQDEPEEFAPAFHSIRGIPEAKMLPGNVGYVDVRLFAPPELQGEDAVQAMGTIAGAGAVIFDLRACMGGVPEMVHFVTSYLYPPEPKHLLTYYHAKEPPDSAYTLAEVPGERLAGADVYVLTSEFTASGGEEFTYVLKHHGRATVVGEKTAGAGHGGGVLPIAAGFEAFVPDFRPVHPVTGGGWEAVGIEPDVACPARKALAVAHRMALEAIQEREPARAEKLGDVIASLDEELARMDEPVVVDVDALSDYVGVYEIRAISLEPDGLHLQREGGPKLLMVAAAEPDSFTLQRVPQAKIRFERDDSGAVARLHVLGMQGKWEVTARSE